MIVFVSVFTDKSLKEEEEFAAEEAIEKRIVVSRRLEEHAYACMCSSTTRKY